MQRTSDMTLRYFFMQRNHSLLLWFLNQRFWFKDNHNRRCEALESVLGDMQKGWGQLIDYLILSDSDSSRCFHKLWKSICLFMFLAYKSERHSFHFQFGNKFFSWRTVGTQCYISCRCRKAFFFFSASIAIPIKMIWNLLLSFTSIIN